MFTTGNTVPDAAQSCVCRPRAPPLKVLTQGRSGMGHAQIYHESQRLSIFLQLLQKGLRFRKGSASETLCANQLVSSSNSAILFSICTLFTAGDALDGCGVDAGKYQREQHGEDERQQRNSHLTPPYARAWSSCCLHLLQVRVRRMCAI